MFVNFIKDDQNCVVLHSNLIHHRDHVDFNLNSHFTFQVLSQQRRISMINDELLLMLLLNFISR